jgi:hypothetical protein
MFATAGGPSFAGHPLSWNLFFARQPEPDLEFTEEELEQTMNVRSSSPMKPPKKSGKNPLIWILLLTVVGGGAYVAMEPEMVMDFVGPLLGETPEPPPPPLPVARKPAPPKPAPSIPPSQPQQAAPAPPAPPATIEPPAQPPQASVSEPELKPTPTPATNMPPPSIPKPAPKSLSAPAPVAPPTHTTVDPLFVEGQRVTVLPNPGAPRQKVSLMKDAAGTQPGPAIPPGTAFTILDGDLQDSGWMYYVRSDYGTKGWLQEKQLRMKR